MILRRAWLRTAASCVLLCGAMFLYGADATTPMVGWDKLKALNPDIPAVKQTAVMEALDSKTVSIAGFMVPLEDDAQHVSEFLLVPFAGACIHVPPPPPNQMVYVKMSTKAAVKVSFNDPIVVTGQLKISTVTSPYGDVSYDLSATTVKPYKD